MKTRLLSALTVFAFAVTMSAQWSAQSDMPAYHDAVPKKAAKLAPILKPEALHIQDSPWAAAQKKSYILGGEDSPACSISSPASVICDRPLRARQPARLLHPTHTAPNAPLAWLSCFTPIR